MSHVDSAAWPDFMNLLDSNPPLAAEQLYIWVCGVFATAPPRLFRSLSDEDRQEAIHDIVVHCMREDFRVLRQYSDQGKPFAGWFYFVANNRLRDMIRLERRRPGIAGEIDPEADFSCSGVGASTQTSIEERRRLREVIGSVNTCIRLLDKHCQLLLRLAADEFRPREMVRILRWASEKAPKVSDDLRYCREKLGKLLQERGITTSVGE